MWSGQRDEEMASFQVSESIYSSGLFAGSSCLLWIGLPENSRTKFKFKRSLMQIKTIKRPLRKLTARRSRGLNALSDERNLRQEHEERFISSDLPLSRASQTRGCKPLICQNSWKETETLNLGSPSRAHGWVLFYSVVIHSSTTYWAPAMC